MKGAQLINATEVHNMKAELYLKHPLVYTQLDENNHADAFFNDLGNEALMKYSELNRKDFAQN